MTDNSGVWLGKYIDWAGTSRVLIFNDGSMIGYLKWGTSGVAPQAFVQHLDIPFPRSELYER